MYYPSDWPIRCVFCGQGYDPTRRKWLWGLVGPIRIHWCPNYRKLRLQQGPLKWEIVSK